MPVVRLSLALPNHLGVVPGSTYRCRSIGPEYDDHTSGYGYQLH